MALSDYPIRRPQPPPDHSAAVEEIKRTGAEVVALAKRLRADYARQSTELRAATDAARQVLAFADAGRAAGEEQRELLVRGWDHAIGVLEEIEAAREDVEKKVAEAARLVPAPGSGAPGALAPVPNLYPGGISQLSFLYAQIQATLQLDGSTPMTGSLTLNQGAQIGVGRTPAHELDVNLGAASPLRASLSSDTTGGGSNIGLWLDKTDKTQTWSHCVVYRVGGGNCWAAGMDVGTNNTGNGGTGNADFIPAFDYTGGYDDTGARTIPGGIDVLRFTPAEASTTGKCTTFQIAGQGAGRNASHYFGQLVAGVNLGGIQISANVGSSYDHLQMTQRASTHNRVAISFANANDSADLWIVGTDLGATGRTSWGFQLYDQKTTSGVNTRLFVEGTNNARAKVGLNTAAPLANLHIPTGSAVADYNTVQTALTAGFDGSDLLNRMVNLQQIVDASTANQYLWLNGSLGSTSTRVTPTATVTNGIAVGIEAQDAAFSVVCAPNGTNQTISRPLQVANAALGFFGTTPQAQPAGNTDVLASLVTLGLRAASANPPLNLGTGTLTCGALAAATAVFSGPQALGGASGAGLSFVESNPTPSSDADYTLTAAQAQAFLVVLSTGSWTAGHNVIMPATTGGMWMVNNSSSFTATFKTSGGSGVAIAAGKSAFVWCNGTNIIRITPDT